MPETCTEIAAQRQPALYSSSSALVSAGCHAGCSVFAGITSPPHQRRPGRALHTSGTAQHPFLDRRSCSAPHTAPAPLRRGPYLVTCQCRASKPYASSSLALLGLVGGTPRAMVLMESMLSFSAPPGRNCIK